MDLNVVEPEEQALRVLLIAASGPAIAAVSRGLAPAGTERYDLDVATTLVDGLARLDRARPDCVLVDVHGPDAAGTTALEELRAQVSTVPIIALTGDNDGYLGPASLRAGAQDHLSSADLDPPVLRRSIRHVVSRQRQHRLLTAARDVLAQDAIVREQAEAELQRSAVELARSNADLAEFAYVAAHDLRSPLGIISGYAQLLADLPAVTGDAEALELVGHVVAGVDRMEALIDDLLTYCSIGTTRAEHAPVDLYVLAATTCSPLVQRAAGGAGAIDIGGLPKVMGDEGQLRQLLDNLTTNAVKFVPAGRDPRVVISAERDSGGWCVTVADNGPGIPAEERERAFGMFQRVHDGGGVPGTGIGLAICHRVVEQHGGRIWIEANEPVGTRVRVWLPAA